MVVVQDSEAWSSWPGDNQIACNTSKLYWNDSSYNKANNDNLYQFEYKTVNFNKRLLSV